MTDDEELNPVVDFIAHHWWSFWGGIIVVEVIGAFYDGALSFFFVILAIVGWSFITKRSNSIHGRNLCLRCIQDIPDNPQAEVDRHKRQLHLVHKTAERPWAILLLIPLWFAWSVAATMIQIQLGFPDSFQKALGPLVIFTPLLIMDRAASLHNRLSPWCPWCRKRGGGKDVPEVTPTPDPSGRKTV